MGWGGGGGRRGAGGGGRGAGGGGACWEGPQLRLVLANRPLADPGFLGGGGGYPWVRKMVLGVGEDLEGGACSDNLYTSGPRPQQISHQSISITMPA